MHDYESPIRIIQGKMEEEIVDNIYKVVQSYDIEVDKEELLKALRYDRAQYDKGYAMGYADGFGDGISNAKRPKWISVKDRLPDETKDEYVLVVCDYHGKIKVETRKMWHIDSVVTHWMPMPNPPATEGAK